MTIESILNLIRGLSFTITKNNHPYYQLESIGGKAKTRVGTKYEQVLWNSQRIININAESIDEFVHIGIKEDGGTRTSFNGLFRNIEELQTILNCVS